MGLFLVPLLLGAAAGYWWWSHRPHAGLGPAPSAAPPAPTKMLSPAPASLVEAAPIDLGDVEAPEFFSSIETGAYASVDRPYEPALRGSAYEDVLAAPDVFSGQIDVGLHSDPVVQRFLARKALRRSL